METANEPDAITFAVASTVRFGVQTPADQPFSQYTDLGDFVNRVAYASKKQEVKDATAKLLGFIKQKLVIANSAININASGVDYGKAVRGISIKMIPLTQLSKDSQWGQFLAWAGKIYYQPR